MEKDGVHIFIIYKLTLQLKTNNIVDVISCFFLVGSQIALFLNGGGTGQLCSHNFLITNTVPFNQPLYLQSTVNFSLGWTPGKLVVTQPKWNKWDSSWLQSVSLISRMLSHDYPQLLTFIRNWLSGKGRHLTCSLLGPNAILHPRTDKAMPTECALQPVVGMKSQKPPQGTRTNIPLLWGCSATASVLESWTGLGPWLYPCLSTFTEESHSPKAWS